MILTGAVLAFVIWLVVLYAQPKAQAPKNAKSKEVSSSAILENYALMPASILSANQSNETLHISGTGVAGSTLSVYVQQNSLINTKVDESANWNVALPFSKLDDVQNLEFLMTTPDGQQIRSDQSLILVRHPHNADMNTVIEAESKNPENALIVLTAPGAPSRVLQTPYNGFPKKDGFSLESIDYDNSGGVIFSGTADPSGRVRIYANGKNVGESRVTPNGRWTLIFGNIMPLGEYIVQAEYLDNNTQSLAKLSLPFARMTPLFENENSPKIVVDHLADRIQIGRALFGGGYQYTVVYAPSALEEE